MLYDKIIESLLDVKKAIKETFGDDGQNTRGGRVYSSGPYGFDRIQYEIDRIAEAIRHTTGASGGGSGGTTNYNALSNKPKIENTELAGNKSAADLGLAKPADITAAISSHNSNSAAHSDLRTLIANLANVGHYEKYDSESDIANPDNKTLYIIGSSAPYGIKIYDAASGQFALIDNTNIDLSSYATSGDLTMLEELFTEEIDNTRAGVNAIAALTAIDQPAYTDAPLQSLLAQSADIATSNYFACNNTTVFKFNDVTKMFTLESLDGASRIVGDGVSVKIYFQRDQKGIVTQNNGTYTFAGPALFRGLDGFTGDISGITVTQAAIQSSVRTLGATIANSHDWEQRQIDELKVAEAQDIKQIRLGSLDILTPDNGALTIPFVDSQQEHHDPFDLGVFPDEAGLPSPVPANTQYYAGVDGEKYSPEYRTGTDVSVNPTQVVLVGAAPLPDNQCFNVLKFNKNAVINPTALTDFCNAHGQAAAADSNNLALLLGRNELWDEVVQGQKRALTLESALFKSGPTRTIGLTLGYFSSDTYGYSVNIWNGASGGNSPFSTTNITQDLSAVPGWHTGDTLHFDAAAGELYVIDSAGEKVQLRFGTMASMAQYAQWGLTTLYGYFAAQPVASTAETWLWTDQNASYVPGLTITGENKNGVMRSTQYTAVLNRFTALEDMAIADFAGPCETTSVIPTPYNTKKMYLVGSAAPYQIFIAVDGVLENVGTTEVDVSGKADKVASAVAGHLAGLNASGNLEDSGISADEVLAAMGGNSELHSVDISGLNVEWIENGKMVSLFITGTTTIPLDDGDEISVSLPTPALPTFAHLYGSGFNIKPNSTFYIIGGGLMYRGMPLPASTEIMCSITYLEA